MPAPSAPPPVGPEAATLRRQQRDLDGMKRIVMDLQAEQNSLGNQSLAGLSPPELHPRINAVEDSCRDLQERVR